MKSQFTALLLAVILLSHSSIAICDQSDSVSEFAYESIYITILNSIDISLNDYKSEDKEPNRIEFIADPAGLIILLGEIDNDKSRKLLCKLLHFYIGEANIEALDYAIVKQGVKILPCLRELLLTPIDCSIKTSFYNGKKPIHIKCLTKSERNVIVNDLIRLIESGKKVDYTL